MKNTFSYFFPFNHEPKTYVPTHTHECYELVYYVLGTGRGKVDNSYVDYRKGEIMIYSPNQSHDESHAEKTNVYCIGFLSEVEIPCGKYVDSDEFVLRKIIDISDEIRSKQTDFQSMVSCLLSEILIVLLRSRVTQPDSGRKLLFAKQFIQENLCFDINLEDLASFSGYSYDRFRHLFKEEIGVPPKDYISQKRIEKAKFLLTTTDQTVSGVAAGVGYPELSAFSLFFKKATGLSPNAYRKAYGLGRQYDSITTDSPAALSKE